MYRHKIAPIRKCFKKHPKTKSAFNWSGQQKFLMKVRVGDQITRCAFHDTGAIVSCIGKDTLQQLCPKWKNFPDVDPLPLISHTSHELRIETAKVLPISFPDTDVQVHHPIHVEEGDSDLVIGRDLMTRLKMGMRWKENNRLLVTIPSQDEVNKTFEIPVYTLPAGRATGSNVDEVVLSLIHI